MNKKYMFSTCLVVFALMFTVATPFAMAEPTEKPQTKSTIEVNDFNGGIVLTGNGDRSTYGDLITVSLSEASNGLDVQQGKLGVVINEEGEKFLVWILQQREKISESFVQHTYIVDASDVSNTTHFENVVEIEKRQEKPVKFSESTGDPEMDAIRASFIEKLQELRKANHNGDTEKISEIRAELEELRGQLGDIMSFRK